MRAVRATGRAVGPYSKDGTVQAGVDRPLDLGNKVMSIKGGEVTEY